MKIAILGWGSLLWDLEVKFEKQHEAWCFDGPYLKLEFCRVSQTRDNALTLVLNEKNGKLCQVAYAHSNRKNPDDAICDLRSREGTTLKNIGFYFADGSRQQSRERGILELIKTWAREKKVDVVVWTDLVSNFQEKSKEPFSIDAALRHVQALGAEGKSKAAEYVWCAPDFIDTPLREALQSQPWFQRQG